MPLGGNWNTNTTIQRGSLDEIVTQIQPSTGPPFRKLEHKHNHIEGGSLDEIATHGESETSVWHTPGADIIHKIHMVLRGWWNL